MAIRSLPMSVIAVGMVAAFSALILVSILGGPTGFLTRGSISDASSNVLLKPAVGGVSVSSLPDIFNTAESPVNKFAVQSAAVARLKNQQLVTFSVDGRSFSLTPTMTMPGPSGETLIAGHTADGGYFTMIVDFQNKIQYGKVQSPSDTTKPFLNLVGEAGTSNVFAQRTVDTPFNDETDRHELPPVEVTNASSTSAPPQLQTSSPTSAVVDVLLFYSPQLAAQLGGESQAQAAVLSDVAETNLALQDSGISHRQNVVGVLNSSVVGYNESGNMSADLYAITVDPQIAALRNQYAADLVVLFVYSGQYCGIAFVTRPWEDWAGDYGFSVTRKAPSCNAVTAHETGHNAGAQHDRLNAGAGAFSYSFGYRTPDDDPDFVPRFRTIMAYECTSVSCPRILRYSNPDPAYDYMGHHTGRPQGNQFSADNAHTLQLTYPFVANFRGAVTGTDPVPASTLSASDHTFTTRIRVAWAHPAGGFQYQVWRSTQADMSNAVQVGLVTDSYFDDYAGDNTPVLPETTYYYAVKTINPTGVSAFSNIDGGTLSDGGVGSPVTNLRATDGGISEITVQWVNTTAATNKLFRSTTNSFCDPSTLVGTFTNLGSRDGITINETTSSGLVPGTVYYYSVSSVDAQGEHCVPVLDTGYLKNTTAIPPVPTEVFATNGAFTDRVRVSWVYVNEATSYSVYRNTTNNSATATLLNATPITNNRYDDFTATGTTNYYYWVKSSNAAGTSDFSNGDNGFLYTTPGNCIVPGSTDVGNGTCEYVVNLLPGPLSNGLPTANGDGFAYASGGVSAIGSNWPVFAHGSANGFSANGYDGVVQSYLGVNDLGTTSYSMMRIFLPFSGIPSALSSTQIDSVELRFNRSPNISTTITTPSLDRIFVVESMQENPSLLKESDFSKINFNSSQAFASFRASDYSAANSLVSIPLNAAGRAKFISSIPTGIFKTALVSELQLDDIVFTGSIQNEFAIGMSESLDATKRPKLVIIYR